MRRVDFDHATGPTGAVLVGSPETVARKIVRAATGLGLARFDMKYSMGTMPHEKLTSSIRLYATKVVPLVREQLG
jgi:alkanesulfonate monooxygenase SsuD/methylene tetrahydromethanopterin reductase-like flavin-dependent oxidoreductase (luciferase family)